MKLSGKVAIVTGAASGMGKAIAELFAQEGAKVVASDLNAEGVQAVVKGITEKGGTAIAVTANVAKEEDVQHLIDTAVKTYGTVDILINNAGIMDNFVPAAEITDELWERVFAVNTTGPMRTTRKVLPIFMEKKSGAIVNIASIGGLQGSRAGATYTASKHALIGFTKNVGFQYGEYGIRCNAIAPGGVETNIGTTMNNPSQFGMGKAMSGANNNPRSGKPEEIATIALFLASDDASFVNGAVIVADAGWTAY
ncbi:MAG: 3-ketoacyl-ACP reductase [Thermobacillus sp. ZCTH02-B1]|uniref:SDR family oxidoreductase n=1 Tax=Thermobacillus sp. ZCTH02-B1 TaxID=1858795 RepID=UPI000B5677FE|nr:SDR family oxidoreductase [Thermobacillus sp. ZCTH02-B1]OUM97194.1 MAG: 3-ketoacyl-ACP reductase [Thermobacillus sp. ZCTH02-B1]